jgi:hypothetical protein
MALLKQDKENRTSREDDDAYREDDDNDAYTVYLERRGKKRARSYRVTIRRERMATERDHSRRRSPAGPYTGLPLVLI